jgi:putative ABC transport system permease protein
MASIARKNLIEHPIRLSIALAGILFAVGLVILQTGIYTGFTRSVSFLITNSRADVWVASESMVNLSLTLPIPYENIQTIRGLDGVARAEPIIFRGASWRNNRGQLSSITLVGLDPNGQLFYPVSIKQGQINTIKTPYTVLVDQTSLKALNVNQVGNTGVIAALPAQIRGLTQGTQSIVLGSIVFSSLESARAYTTTALTTEIPCSVAVKGINCAETPANFPPKLRFLRKGDTINYILVRAAPGTDLNQLKQIIKKALPNTRILTRAEMAKQTQDYWESRSSIGFILGLGGVVGIIVGIVVVGQILYSSVSDNIREFATLKAIGGTNRVLYQVIGEQALWMSILGYLPGLAISIAIAQWAEATQGILILISPLSALYVLGITILMCLIAAIFAIRKVTKLDPASVFRG